MNEKNWKKLGLDNEDATVGTDVGDPVHGNACLLVSRWQVRFGDAANPLPGRPSSLSAWIATAVVVLMFVIGIAAPIALLRGIGHGGVRRLLVALMWAGRLILLARGISGLIDDAVRALGISSTGITGLSYQDVLGTAHPSTYILISGATIDAYFLLGGILYGWAALSSRHTLVKRNARPGTTTLRRR